ncbi:hypothetical protein LCGC14_2857630 [marine sediment metagenome]|uniref:Uncharacterized protein n=1 Tax=marine sediment metagenome TaxID=412755 RepID=A0A0F8Y6T5_9ZZZZ
MPCAVLFHVKLRGIIDVQPVGYKWGKQDKRLFQPVILPFMTVEEARPYKGRNSLRPGEEGNHAIVDVDSMHRTDGDRAAMRNPKLISPPPRNLKAVHIIKGPEWGKNPADYT